MKKILYISLFFTAFTISAQATDFESATTDTWVAGNPANEAVSLVNEIICFLKNATGSNVTEFLGKKFKSVVYMNECEQSSGGGAQDASRGTGGSSQNAAKGEQSSQTNAAEESKDSMIVVNDIATRASDSDPIVSKAWVYMPDTDGGGGMDSGDREIYLENTITSGVTTENPYGAFSMTYTMTVGEDGGFLPLGAPLGEGYLNVSGAKAEFIERSFGRSEMQAFAEFSQTEEGDVKGVIVKGGETAATGLTGAGDMFKAYYAFNVDKSANLYCEKLLSAEKISFDQNALAASANQDSILGATAGLKPTVGDALSESDLATAGLSTDAKCLSTAASNKKKSVWQYGIYNSTTEAEYTGATSAKKAPFPIFYVSGSDEYRGYASHWGVHVDYEVTDAQALAADWKNEEDSTDTNVYKLFQTYGKLQKFTNSFLALEDLNKVRVRLYIGYADDAGQKAKFTALGFTKNDFDGADNTKYNADDDYHEYEGYYDKTNNNFCFDMGLNWYASSNNMESLSGTCDGTSTNGSNTPGAVVEFTGAEWFAQHGDYSRIYLWSPESGSDYAIRKSTTENPTSRESANGIKVQSREWVDIESVADGKFICLKHCPTVAGVNAAAKSALDAIVAYDPTDPSTPMVTLHDSPYNAAIGPHFKSAGTIADFWGDGQNLTYLVGQSFWDEESSVYLSEGSSTDDVAIYTIEGGKFYEGTTAVSNAEVTWSTSTLTTEVNEVLSISQSAGGEPTYQPYAGMKMADLLWGHRIKMTDYHETNYPGRFRDMGWAIESGYLIENTAANRSTATGIGCDYASGTTYFTFGNNKPHPRLVTVDGFQATDTRLCHDKIREGFAGTYYKFYLKPRAQWSIKTGGQVINFFKPETMYFNTALINTPALEQASGIQEKDKNKIVKLEFSGARQLWGIPGNVWDFCTDTAKGDQVRQWNSECYRYIDRFIIPDGLTINTAADYSGTSYKVKALGIDEFLTPTASPSNIATMFDGLTKSLLPTENNLKNLSPKGGSNFIGTKPPDSELEGNGKAQVIQGKKVTGDS